MSSLQNLNSLIFPMARRKTSSTTQAVSTPSLALSDLHIRLEVLEKEQQSLQKQIKKKRTELKNLIEQMRSFATEMYAKVAPLFQKISDMDQEIHTLFDEIFATRKLGKQTRKSIESVYRNLQRSGVISARKNSAEEDDDDDDEFNFSDIFEDEENAEEFRRRFREHQAAREEQESPSADRSSDESRKIRQTFLKLAEIFHPDKATESEMQARHTEIMQEINKAYQDGDLARLLEIEQQHEVGEVIDNSSEDDLTRKCKSLEQQNKILKNQYEKLKGELRSTKTTPEGAMIVDCKKASKKGFDPVNQMLEEANSQVEVVSEIRDFVKNFREQKMTIKDFLAGPEILNSMEEESMEDLLDQMFEELGVVIRY
jgi:chaperonin cofactor prefoldin